MTGTSGGVHDQNNILDEIAEAVGLETARILAASFGGTELYIPSEVSNDHQIMELIGEPAFTKLVDHFRVGRSGIRILIPMGQKWERLERQQDILRLSAEGLSAPQIAKHVKIHVRTVFRCLAKTKKRHSR